MLLGLFAGAAIALVGSSALVLSVLSMSIVSFAVVEELVFRIALPSYLAELLAVSNTDCVRRTRDVVVACVIAQAAFALGHLSLPHLASLYGLAEFGRLFGAGLLYAALVAVAGVWLAAGIHAALNFAALLSAGFQPSNGQWLEFALALALGVFVLVHSAGSHRVRRV